MLRFPTLKEAVFVERPNRFLVKAKIDGKSELVHLHDPGRLKELLLPGAKLYLKKTDNPNRKTKWDIILVKSGRQYIAIYSILANRLIKTTLENKQLPGLKSWSLEKAEFTYGNSRFDFLISRNTERMLIEVKSVSLVENRVAMFPDAPTTRGARHLNELAQAVNSGYKTAVMFIVTRDDAEKFMPFEERDPVFANKLKYAVNKGVKAYCFKCQVNRKGMNIDSRIPIKL